MMNNDIASVETLQAEKRGLQQEVARLNQRVRELEQIIAARYAPMIGAKKIEEELRLVQFALDNSAECIHWIEPDGYHLYVNNAACTTLGYTREELLNLRIQDIDTVLFDGQHSIRDWYCLNQRDTVTVESQYRRKDGSVFPVEVTINSLKVNGKEYYFSFMRDITERKQSEEALKTSERRYRALIEDQTELVCRFLPEGELSFVNEAFCNYFGKLYRELIGQNFLSLLPEKKIDILQRHFALCFKNPVAIYDHQLVNADGEVRWLQWTERAIFDAQGYLVEFQSVGRDLTEFRQAQEQLRLAQFTLDQSADGVYWIDSDGKHLYVNDAACAISGYTRAELLAMHVFDIALDLSVEQWREHWQQYMQHGAVTSESLHRRNDGSIVPVDVTTNYLQFNEREYLCSFVRDITERKHMERELHEANDQLRLWIKELEQHNWEVTLLNGMADRLQTCTTVEQAYDTIAQYVAHIFLGQSGALYIFDCDDTHVSAVAMWGEVPPDELAFDSRDCQALQHHRVHLVEQGSNVVQCLHTHPQSTASYLCVPLVNQSEKLGMLHLRDTQTDSVKSRDQWKQMARMVADHIALALGNLLLRNRLHNQSIRDPLTGLYNRRYLKETLEHALREARRNHTSVGVVMIDIDHFKKFNDTYGHDGGDTLLRSFAGLLQQYVRCQDVVCRYGGEEFTVILPGAPLDVTTRRAIDLCESIRHLAVEHEGTPLGRVTASLGVASFPEHATSSEKLITMADKALYDAKSGGRNRVIVAEQAGSVLV